MKDEMSLDTRNRVPSLRHGNLGRRRNKNGGPVSPTDVLSSRIRNKN